MQEILQLHAGSGSNRNRCTPTEMAETGSILLSPLEDDPKSTSINQDLKTEESNLDNTGVADPALVPHDSEDDTTRCSSTLPTQVPEINRLAIIREKHFVLNVIIMNLF
ncbi:hypothetical protein G6F44_013513 [Rhizopus delemar]|nr:hypothetical protein G6F44_013513 [Rhizopus delemar]